MEDYKKYLNKILKQEDSWVWTSIYYDTEEDVHIFGCLFYENEETTWKVALISKFNFAKIKEVPNDFLRKIIKFEITEAF